MDLQEAENLAKDLIAKWLPPEWTFAWDNARQRAGCCSASLSRIWVSRPYAEVNPRWHVEETLLHEICHALAGDEDQGHSRVWKALARAVGIPPFATTEPPVPVPGKWQAVCPRCDFVAHRHKWCPGMAAGVSCPNCRRFWSRNRRRLTYQQVW